MKQKQLLMKTLLAVAMLGAWANARANETANFTTGSWTAYTSTYSLPGASGVYHLTFTTTNDLGAFWHGWALIVTNGKDTHTHGGTQYFTMRHDGYGWDGTTNSNDADYMTGSNTYTTANPSGAGIEYAANGATVDMTITRSSGNVTVEATVTPTTEGYNAYTVSFAYTNGDATADELGLYLGGEYGAVTVTNAYAVNGTVTSTQYGYNFASGETLFTAQKDAQGTGSVRQTISNTEGYVNFATANNCTNGYAFATYDFSSLVEDANLVGISFDCYIPDANYQNYISIADADQHSATLAGHVGYSGANYSCGTNGTIFSFGRNRASGTNYFNLNGSNKSYTSETVLGAWIHVDATIDNDDKTISYTISDRTCSTTYYSGSDVAFRDANASNCSQLDLYTYGNGLNTMIDNLVITKYVDANRYSYTVKAVCGSTELETIVSGTDDNGSTISYYYPRYILNDGNLYYINSKSGTYFGDSFTLSEDDQSVNVSYTKNTTITDVTYLEEAENITGMTKMASQPGRLSCGAGGRCTSATTITTLEPGKYILITATYAAKDKAYTFMAGDETILSFNGNGGWGEVTSDEFTVYTSTDVTAECANHSSYGLDYILIYRTGDATVSATITPAGWSTFASPYALDLSTISGGTVYYASAASGSTVTLSTTDATTVPAGEGIMVKGTPNATFTIDVATSGTAITGNLLKGQTTTGDVAASTEGTYHYVFGYVTETPTTYGFYNLTADTEVEAGKAYLETTEALSTAASRLTIVFDGESTGISATLNDKVETTNDNCIYNLSGQRISQPTRGLYIVNGKKVIIK